MRSDDLGLAFLGLCIVGSTHLLFSRARQATNPDGMTYCIAFGCALIIYQMLRLPVTHGAPDIFDSGYVLLGAGILGIAGGLSGRSRNPKRSALYVIASAAVAGLGVTLFLGNLEQLVNEAEVALIVAFLVADFIMGRLERSNSR